MRLVTFGCSHTYGQGILPEDVQKSNIPSTASWAAKLAKKLNCDLQNYGQPAASINYVVEKLLTYKPESGDIIAITFPNLNRLTLFNILNDIYKDRNCYIIPNGTNYISMQKKLYSLFDDYNLLRLNTQLTDYAYRILESYNLPYVCRFAVYPYEDTIEQGITYHEAESLFNARKDLYLHKRFLEDIKKPTLIDHMFNTEENKRYGADGLHFSELIHENFAEDFYNEVRKLL
jgi:hypothetical protein